MPDEDECVEDVYDYATYCPDCDAIFYQGDEGWDYDECIECGSPNVYEVGA